MKPGRLINALMLQICDMYNSDMTVNVVMLVARHNNDDSFPRHIRPFKAVYK